MRTSLLTRVLGAAALAIAAGAAHASSPVALSGEYVETRTCNVYTGACHANGEAVTMGREAMLAWHIDRGTAQGVDLGGLTAVAVMAGNENLAWGDASRHTVLYIDERANSAQRAALAEALKTKYARALGDVVAVKVAPVDFAHNGLEYSVRVPHAVYLKTTRYSCDHCVMQHEIWYDPFVNLKSSIVAKAAVSEFKGAPELSTKWRRLDENSSFVGEFAL